MNGEGYDRVEVWEEEAAKGRPPEIRLHLVADRRPDVVIPLDVARAEKLIYNLRGALASFYRRSDW